jgi:gas vesicle protein
MRKNSVSIFALLLGIVLGIIGGILFAPAKGTNIRNVLTYRVKRYTEKLQELLKTLLHTKTGVSNQAKTASQELIKETIDRAKQLLEDANELAAELEQ